MQSKLVRRVEPLVPAITTLKWLDVNVYLQVIVDREGAVETVSVLRGGHPLLNEAAIRLRMRSKIRASRVKNTSCSLLRQGSSCRS